MPEFTTITTEREGRVFLIGLNRPKTLNAFNRVMLEELSAAFTEYEKDSDLWCALLFAHGDHFSAGLDLADVGPAVASGVALFPEEGVDPLDLHEPRRTKPVVCAVQGWCLTIGIELLLACDIRVASSSTRFAQMEVKRGIMPFGGASLRFPQIAGWGNAMLHLLTGDEFDAQEALRIGLVQRVVDSGLVIEEGKGIAHKIAARAPLAVQATLASAKLAVEKGFASGRDALMEPARSLMKSDDAAEGMRSFVERRDAVFKGR